MTAPDQPTCLQPADFTAFDAPVEPLQWVDSGAIVEFSAPGEAYRALAAGVPLEEIDFPRVETPEAPAVPPARWFGWNCLRNNCPLP